MLVVLSKFVLANGLKLPKASVEVVGVVQLALILAVKLAVSVAVAALAASNELSSSVVVKVMISRLLVFIVDSLADQCRQATALS